MQLAELELLMSMYPNKGELEFDDTSELADLRAALNSDNATISVGGVGFTLHLTIMQVVVQRLIYRLARQERRSRPANFPCRTFDLQLMGDHLYG